jgi:glycosyltransferase involved in cell wall biosynthesis
MRILMTTDTIGGVWTYTMDLIKGLEKYNVEVILATMGDPLSAGQLAQVRKLKKVILDASNYKLEWMPDPWKDIERAQRWLLQLSFNFSPDVIHFNSYGFDCRLFNAPVVMVGHSCVSSWWQAVKNEAIPMEWSRYAALVKRGLQSADVVVAPSYTMMMYLVEYYGSFSRSQVIYNAGDETYFKPGKKEKIIFSMGRIWDEAKNIKLLNEIAGEMDYPVFIAGGDRKSASNKVSSNVHYLGKLDKKEVARWLSLASVFVLPALYEPFGLSVLEAAYSGCALVLGRIDSLQELWQKNALYCDPRNPQELKTTLNEVMTDDALRKRFADAALKRSSEFKLSAMAGAYYSLYSTLTGIPRLHTSKQEFVNIKS